MEKMSVARLHRVAVRIAFAAACLLTPKWGTAQDARPTDYQVKAAYLTNLGRFVSQWSARPGSPDETFDICILGPDPFGSDLDRAVKGEKIGASPLAAKRISSPQEATGCRVLYIGATGEAQLNTVLSTLGTAPVLTVSDIPGFVRRGGMIQFFLDGDHVRLEINVSAARRAGLTLSSELLKIARSVRRTP
jgi:hypothetical protein